MDGGKKFVSGLQWYGAYKTYSVKPKKINEQFGMVVPAERLNKAAVDLCNASADARRELGFSDGQIFSKDRVETMNVTMRQKVSLTGMKSKVMEEVQKPYKLKVRCAKSTTPALPKLGTIKKPKPATPGFQAPAAAKPTSQFNSHKPKMKLKIGN